MKKLTALFAFAFFLVFVGWAITPVQADPPRPAHKHGDGGVEGVTYCAELFSNDAEATGNGAFEWFGSVPVIPNEKENGLRFPDNPMVSPQGGIRGSSGSPNDWYRVFDDCDVFDVGAVHEGTLLEGDVPFFISPPRRPERREASVSDSLAASCTEFRRWTPWCN